MAALEIQSEIDGLAQDYFLREENNFTMRAEAIDLIEFDVMERIEGLLPNPYLHDSMVALKQYAESVKLQLEDIDDGLFRRLRADIRMSGNTGFKEVIDQYVGPDLWGSRCKDGIGYDHLDTFINGLLHIHTVPLETKPREPGMVYYQKTPARIILEMAEKARFTKEDVFFDLGSGLGQVPILVHLLSGATAKGIEFEPAYCEYARACAEDLHLPWLDFQNTDARAVNYSTGTAYFMYSPFEGKILTDVLDKMERETQKGTRLFTFGPCTSQVSRQKWLRRVDQNGGDAHKLAVFERF